MSINPSRNFSGIEDVTPVYYAISEFEAKVLAGEINDSHGVGYYANDEKISSVRVRLNEFGDPAYTVEGRQAIMDQGGIPPMMERMADGTHVAWFPYKQ